MPGVRPFLDTNVLVYALVEEGKRAELARSLLFAGDARVGVQSLNEFAATCLGKLKLSWDQTLDYLRAIRALVAEPIPLTDRVHMIALRIARRHRFAIYDSLLLAAALEAGCDTFYSEDMSNGMAIGSLTIVNPFPHR